MYRTIDPRERRKIDRRHKYGGKRRKRTQRQEPEDQSVHSLPDPEEFGVFFNTNLFNNLDD